MQTILILYHSNEFSLINKFFNLFIHIMCMYVKTAKQIYIYIYIFILMFNKLMYVILKQQL